MMIQLVLISLATFTAAEPGQEKGAALQAIHPGMNQILEDREKLQERLQKDMPRKSVKQVSHLLGLAACCRWEEAAREIRSVIRDYPKQCHAQKEFFIPLLFVLEFAAATSLDDLEKIFSTGHARFDAKEGILLLRYPDGVPQAWEVQGNRKDGGGTVLLPRKGAFRLNVPFLRAGVPPFHGARSRVLHPCVFQGRLCELQPESSLALICRTVVSGKEISTVFTIERLQSGSGQSLIELKIDGKTRSRQKPVDMGKGIFSNWSNISSTVENQQVKYAVGGTFKRTMAMPAGGSLHFELRGDGRGAVLDWVEVSGPVDGLWLAYQLVLRSKDQGAAFWQNWGNPIEDGMK